MAVPASEEESVADTDTDASDDVLSEGETLLLASLLGEGETEEP